MTRHALMFQLLVLVIGVAANAGEPLPLEVKTKRDDDQVAVRTEKNRAEVSIRSPQGISSAIIRRTGKNWPASIVVRLQLRGLENLVVSNDKIKLAAAVSSQSGRSRIWKDNQEDSPLDNRSPYWMNIRLIDRDGKPASVIPLPDGYFEVSLPSALFAENPPAITISWIDFYRN